MLTSSLFNCPHCKASINMDENEQYVGHVTYWAEDGPKPMTCPSCEADIYVQEHVARWWEAGRTPEEAADA